MKLKHLLILAAMLSTSNVAFSQLFPKQTEKEDLISKLPFAKKMSVAKDLFRDGSYYNAEKYFFQLKQEQPRNPYLAMMLAETYEKNRDYPKAADMFRNAYDLAPALYPNFPYREALMLKADGKYPEAKARLVYFLANFKSKDKKMKIYAQRQMDGCDMALKSLANPDPVFVKNAGPNINTAFTESSPLPLGDTALVFSTMNSNKLVETNRDKRADYVSRLMWSPKEFDRTRQKDSFEVSMKFNDGRFNDSRYHVSNGSWSPGGDRFYFTKCNESSETDSFTIKCKIFVSNFDTIKGIWGAPKNVDAFINEEGSSNTTPCIAIIGKKEVLFFSSNRIGQSAGGFDIWYSVYDPKNRTYRRPQNCGKRINSNRDETTPFYSNTQQRLYWSSNGFVTMGGFDVFSADGGPTRYANIKNLGSPYNSPADDLYYIEGQHDKGNAYLVSNRIGSTYIKNPTCCDDIYRVIKNPNLSVKGRVIDAKTNQVLDKVVVKLNDDNAGKVVDTFFSGNGGFTFKSIPGKSFTLTADKVGYTTGRATYSTTDKTAADPDEESVVDIYVNKITSDYTFHVQNVYYDFDLQRFQPNSYLALDTLANFMKDNPSLSVEVYANTDGRGSEQYNQDLSIKRAEEVITYLTGKGVERARMIARPQAANVKASPNEKDAAGKDNPEARALNRRTYFRIIGDSEGKRVIYDNNRPEYIDKSGSDARGKNLEVPENEEADQGKIPEEAAPKK